MLTDEEGAQAVVWIKANITPHPRKTFGSYETKHLLQKELNIYTLGEEFQDLLVGCGFKRDKKYKSTFYGVVSPALIKKYYS